MTTALAEPATQAVGADQALALIDVDIHTRVRTLADLRPYLSRHWWDYLQTYGIRQRHGFVKGPPFPKAQPSAARRDAWPPDGGAPASDLAFLRAQHLDHYGITTGIMNPLFGSGQGDQNDGLSAAMAAATNEWQLDAWVSKEPRLKASVVVPYDDPPEAAAEIRRRAGDTRFGHVLLLSRMSDLPGKRRFWPIYEAAAEAGLPIGIHVFGYSGRAMTGSGWGSFYIEEMTEHATSCQALVTSMIVEGVFEHLPSLKVVMIESGFGWLAPLGWRLDTHWRKLRHEVPHLRHAPSEYLRRHFWVATQPMEEPERPKHLLDAMAWVGWDRFVFASDYPHWDFDDPRHAIPAFLGEEKRRAILAGNARALYGFA
ncbi:amidohydrolase family protein [Elioraea sp.]|uniref:amidohydrolase family protein n=1 Tax=Elioraea sp. TaxID=2185103 RepID=UPI003F714CFE